ncbi:MAG: acyl carrier protein [bacterium]|nr:acyl carrier protein [Deltaproteobacteria bacterium]MCP4907621.1 acyl carrier protein [bacterium]
MNRTEIEEGVREVLAARAKIPIDVRHVDGSQSLYDVGMTSHATVKVMLGLEDHFEIEFPDEMLQRSIFDQIFRIVSAVEKLLLAS